MSSFSPTRRTQAAEFDVTPAQGRGDASTKDDVHGRADHELLELPDRAPFARRGREAAAR